MVVALRDVRVRGEIHTIIDYAVDMLQSNEFVNNQIHTGWLDSRIAANVKAERPPWHLCVIGAAAVRAHRAFACRAAEIWLPIQGSAATPYISLIYFQVTGLRTLKCLGAARLLPRVQAVEQLKLRTRSWHQAACAVRRLVLRSGRHHCDMLQLYMLLQEQLLDTVEMQVSGMLDW